MKKSTSARIEDTLDVVADKIIDLENTAKQLEQIKLHISKEVDRVESTIVRVDIEDLITTIVTFDRSLDTTNEDYIKKLKKINRGFMYVILAQIALILYVGHMITEKHKELFIYLEQLKQFIGN